jgi:hypothetical protein
MFGQLMGPWADKDLPVIVKSKTRCIRGLEHDRYLSSQMGSEGFVNSYTLGFEKSGDYVEIWFTVHLSEIVVYKVIKKFTFDSASYFFFVYILTVFLYGFETGSLYLKARVLKMSGASSPWRLKFVGWRRIFSSPQYGPSIISPSGT